jgi:transcriptional regulator with XRE-family HTH domain
MARSTNSIFALPEEPRSALKNLGQRLRALRLAQNMTVEHLAERLLCSPTTYRALESGKPTVNLGLLAHALWLFGKTDELDKLFPLEIGMLGNKRSQRARPATNGISDDERDF